MRFPRFGVRARVALTAVLITLLFQPSSPAITHANAPLDDWPMFLYDVGRSSFNPMEVRTLAR